MVMVLANGLANAGTATAMTANNARERTNELVFMRVIHLSIRIESAANRTADGQTLLTRGRRASSLRPEDTTSSWTNGRKDCVSRPRGCHRGVFSSSLELPRNQLHSYRRRTAHECFAALPSFF